MAKAKKTGVAAKSTGVVRKRVSIDELKKFVEVFQKASSIEEVVEVMNWKLEKVRTQATRLRKRGVALKNFPKQSALSEVDIASLADSAEKWN